MGASQCCQGANQGDKKHEVNYDNQNSIQKAKKIKNIGKDNKLEHVSQYSLNPTNCQSDQQNVRQDSNDSSDSSSDSSITSNKKKGYRFSQQVEDIFSDEQQPSELINEIQRIKGINKEPSEYFLLMKEKYIIVSKVLKKQYFRYMKHHAKSKEEILELKVLEKQIKNTIFQEFFKNELIISQKDGENAKNRLVKFTKSNGYDYLSLQKLDIWFDEEWYTEQNEIIDIIKGISQNCPRYLEELCFNFWGTKIGIQGCIEMCRSIRKQKKLQYFDLNIDSGDIGSIGITQIGLALQTVQSLETIKLNLSSNDIDYKGIKRFFDKMERIQNLKNLDLIMLNNRIGENGGITIAENLKQIGNLCKINLNIGGNKIGSKAAVYILEQLVSIKSLNYLYLGLRQFTQYSNIQQQFG